LGTPTFELEPQLHYCEEASLPIPETPTTQFSQKNKRTRVKWSANEDKALIDLVAYYGKNWKAVAAHFPNKSVKNIEKRWRNRYDPEMKHSNWTAEEDELIIRLFSSLGGKWIRIAQEFPGRCPDAIKNRYYSVLRKHSN
jgi:myb proto-oncogene protein